MAKTKHNNLLDTIDEIITDAQKKGIVHLYSEDEYLTGKSLRIKGKDLVHFGTCGYLGLEQDQRLKNAVIDAVQKFGTQFPMSKTYVSSSFYTEIEGLLREMYGSPILITKNSTLGHLTVIPTIVRDDEAVILDQQVHASVQSAVQLLKPKGIHVEIVRHSNLEMLEERVKELSTKYSKVWYMADSVYSMYGDFAPIPEMVRLSNQYEKLNLLIDDAHGMSWAGTHGTGYAMSQLGRLSSKIVLSATMGKGFGVSGGLYVFPTEDMCRRVKVFGGPLTFSVQMEPPMLGAAIASAKIHLSEDIYQLQNELKAKIQYCNEQIAKTDLPLMVSNESPIFFIGTGMPATGYNFVKRLMQEGYYVNLGVFPAVPLKNTGVRFTISRHNDLKDIDGLVQAMAYHYPKAIEEEGRTQNEVRRAFKLPLLIEAKQESSTSSSGTLTLHHEKSIEKIDKTEWNSLLGYRGGYDWDALQFMQTSFSHNIKPEQNWDFNYFIIRDASNRPILATYFTTALCKDDIFANPSISMQIEEKRKNDPYYLTSKVMAMGGLFTEGDHLYLNKTSPEWKNALSLLFNAVSKEQEKSNASLTMLRDFEDNDKELKDYLLNAGFAKIDVPESCEITNFQWQTVEDYISTLSYKSRRHFRTDILKYEHFFNVEVKEEVSEDELNYLTELFRNVKANNYAINNFDFPNKVFSEINKNKNWEFIILKIKDEFNTDKNLNPVAVMFCYKNANNTYCPMLVGMDYKYLNEFNIYRQALYQTILRAKAIGAKKVNFGISASFEKKKVGSVVIPKIAYIQAKDNFNLELIESIAVQKQAS